MINRAISVIDESFSNIEIIFVDDASTDNTDEVVVTFIDSLILLTLNKYIWIMSSNRLASL
jgi:glycosyltransferase involved in cell wall biosynthesis